MILKKVHTLVIGSGAAGLNAAVRLHAQGIEDLVILTEGLECGTSINTGSDKQTYYKIGLYNQDNDSPQALAQTYYAGGSMHGDLALVESAMSAQAFMHLVNLGVPFPRDQYGQFIGYKTDHDPLRRATSCGPYTSREMCLKLIDEVKKRKIEVHQNKVVVALVTLDQAQAKRVCGCIAINQDTNCLESYQAENVVFATGGPGGLYKTSVYPKIHTGAIGLALEAGALAQSLPESQYGLASTKFRWNVSGTYMQVIPRFISTDAKGQDFKEFLRPHFDSVGQMNSMIFLKGYQWPFDSRKVVTGSSIIDILVYIESEIKGRRVFLDFCNNSDDFSFEDLSPEAFSYLEKSKALSAIPIERLRKMNPSAIKLYQDHGINLAKEALEIAVCAQHNNGGLSGNKWWESTNIKHLFPIGEVNGSHGVYRPGGSALNAGQVAAFRAAEFISHKYDGVTLDGAQAQRALRAKGQTLQAWLDKPGARSWVAERQEFQARMSTFGAHIRSPELLPSALKDAWSQYHNLKLQGSQARGNPAEALRNLQLCLAHVIYLAAINQQVSDGIGSRGSALILDSAACAVHASLGPAWNFQSENEEFRNKILETSYQEGKVISKWVACRKLPLSDGWFENIWADYRKGDIYDK